MPPLPSREVLQSWKRVDIQRLCKDYGVRANLKTEALIDLLLETQSAPALAPTPTPAPPPIEPTVTRRSSRTEHNRTNSIIIHDFDEVGEDEDAAMREPESTPPVQEEPLIKPPITQSRTRKAKELQTSLGVGRPKAAGGSGARAVTRSTSSAQKSRKARSSRMASRFEPAIQEEAEPTPAHGSNPTVGQSQTSEVPEQVDLVPLPETFQPSAPQMDIDSRAGTSKQILDAVEPLHIRMDAIEKDFNALDLRNTEIDKLKSQLSSLEGLQDRYAQLEAEVKQLRSQSTLIERLQQELKLLREGPPQPVPRRLTTPPLPSTPRARSPRVQLAHGVAPSGFKSTAYPPVSDQMSPSESPRRASNSSTMLPTRPGLSQTTLGKRPRDSTNDMTGILEESEQGSFSQEDLATKVLRPNKKRPRLETDNQYSPGTARRPSNDVADQLAAPRIPDTSDYSMNDTFGQSYMDPPPPTEQLLDYRAPPSPAEDSSQRNSSGENQDPFNFKFAPMSSTPLHASGARSFMAPFPFPESLQSPAADLSGVGTFPTAHEGRPDFFRRYGSPSKESETQVQGTSSMEDKQSEVSSNHIATGLGLTMVRTRSSIDPMNYPEPPPAKKTMYGTELEGETRFGDFGVEGVASGFWSSGN